ncbi:hypothetical protein [Sphingomonas prati]|uniref:Uncharacterized protein n=1 Tax=Sphingomonas prati TaxID=1843237 RepID=A0A7W9BRF7_9SPHN|nr:hypothetical protein [Sphingomonas prati]MBB5728782.1 hypothetical protein [Sphingomonas prati]
MAQLPLRTPRAPFLTIAAALSCGTVPAHAADTPPARPAVFQSLIACRDIGVAADRLACFDRESALLDKAERNRDVVVVDRGQVRAARRTLFGLTLPSLVLFGGERDRDTPEGKAEAAEVDRLETTIRGASRTAMGKWIIVLQDGARWVQIDERSLPSDPRAGQPIRIRRAAMGSYLANVNNQIAIRVRREN